jgi:small neutral amino acid transporter SnatA (MarC family)
MKFYIRRAVAGVIAIPFVAGAWVFFYLMLLVAGAEPSQSLEDTFNNGLFIGWTVAVMFTFSPQVSKLLAKISGE